MTEYVGFDVSKEETAFCVKDAEGKVAARGKVATERMALFEALREHCLCPARIVMETETLSGWLARELGKLGIAIDVIDARQAHAVMRLQRHKTDVNDVEPYAYLKDVLERMTRGHPMSRLDDLLPWNWKASNVET